VFDSHIIFQVVLISLIGGIIGLDRTAAGQFMISQPIVAGPLTGWVLGDAHAGFVIGAVLELIWVLDMPIGTFVPADATIAAVSATALASLGGRAPAPLSVLGFCVLLSIGTAPLTMFADSLIRKRNARLAVFAVAGPGEDAITKLSRAHLSGLVMFFFKSFLLYLIILPTGLVALRLFGFLPEKIHSAMALFVKVLPVLGAALMLRKLSTAYLDRFLLIGLVIVALSEVSVKAPAYLYVLPAIVAGWIGVKFIEKRAS